MVKIVNQIQLLLYTVLVVVTSYSVSARRCTTVLSKNKVEEVVIKDPCIQKYVARCGWLSLEYCTFYSNTFCDKKVNKSMTQYYVVTDCCVGYFEAPNGSCVEKVVGVSYDVVQQNPNDGNPPSESEIYVRPRESSIAEPSKIKLSRGGYAGIICGFLFLAAVIGFIIVAVQKKRRRKEQQKATPPAQNQGQQLNLFRNPSPRSPSPRSPPSNNFRSSSVTDNNKLNSPKRPNQLNFSPDVKGQGDSSVFGTPKQSPSPIACNHSPDTEAANFNLRASPPSSPQGHDQGQSNGECDVIPTEFDVIPTECDAISTECDVIPSPVSTPSKVSPTKVRQIAIDNSEHELLLIATPTNAEHSYEDDFETEVYEEALPICGPSNEAVASDSEQEQSPLISSSLGFKPSSLGVVLDDIAESNV